jgi:type I restriction enzyme M protein
MNGHFDHWRKEHAPRLKALEPGFHPKQMIAELSEDLLDHYRGKALIDAYDVYQHLMDYWEETMQDDCYSISADGWKAETSRVIERKNGKERDKGWTSDMVPKGLLIARCFSG